MELEIVVLVSIGRHPVSGRQRRARTDAQALELGLDVAAASGATLHVVHAGYPESGVLREYLGMGVETLRVLDVPADADPVPALSECLLRLQPALVLTGAQAEAGCSSGCLPYALAAALGDYVVVPHAVELTLDGRAAGIRQALPRGRRRALRATLPAVVTVDAAGPAARQSAYARARRGRIVVEVPAGPHAAGPERGVVRPARARPARLARAEGKTAVERLQALTNGPAHETRIVHPASAADAASRIRAFLSERRLVRGAEGMGQLAAARDE